MITIKGDFNQLNSGRLVLSRLAIHENTPFEEIAASHDRIFFIQGEDIVAGSLEEDPELGGVGVADWDTQDVIRSY